MQVAIEQISINPNQPRRTFNEEELQELSLSIKNIGLLQPPLVRPLKNGNFELIAGERRLRACRLLGHTHIEVNVEDLDEKDSAEAALIENIQRVDLNPIEVALAIRSLMNQYSLSQEEVSQKVGKKRSTVANYLRLLSLPPQIQDSLIDDKISMGHAKVILSLQEIHAQLLLHDNIIYKNLTVRDSEKLLEKLQKKSPQIKEQTRNFILEELQDQLRSYLGTKVEIIEKTKKAGRITIDYYSLDDLERLISLLSLN